MDESLQLCECLKASAAACERELNEVLSGLGISHCQASILVKIKHAGTLTMSAVSKELCCHKSNVTQVVDGLASKGLLERGTSKDDGRVCVLTLTAKGKTVSAKAQTLLVQRAQECVALFTPKERETLLALLKRSIEKHRA